MRMLISNSASHVETYTILAYTIPFRIEREQFHLGLIRQLNRPNEIFWLRLADFIRCIQLILRIRTM